MSLLLSTQLEKFEPRADRSYKLVFGTNELSPEQVGELSALLREIAVIYISPKGIDKQEIDAVDSINPEFDGKTQSERIRNLLYLLWKQPETNGGFKDFDTFYKNKTEKYIEQLKSLIHEQV